jgi:hypothetical protein
MKLRFGFKEWNTRGLIEKKGLELCDNMKFSGLQWMNHPISLIASAEEIDFTSLTKIISKAPSHIIAFKPPALARGYIGAADGQHRDRAVHLLHESTWDVDIADAVAEADKAIANDKLAVADELKKKIDNAKIAKERNSWWVCKVFEECTWRVT